MSLAFLPRRTDAATAANAVRGPILGFEPGQRVRLRYEYGAQATIRSRRLTPGFGFAEYLIEYADSSAQTWVAGIDLAPVGRPRGFVSFKAAAYE